MMRPFPSPRLLGPLFLLAAWLLVDLPAWAQAPDTQATFERLARNRKRMAEPALGPRSTPEATALWADFYAGAAHEGDGERLPHDLYLEILRQWSLEPSFDQVELLVELEYRLGEKIPCIARVENQVLEHVSALDPSATVPALLLHVLAWRHELSLRRFARIGAKRERIERWAGAYVEASGDTRQSRQLAADLLTLFAQRNRESAFVDLLWHAVESLDLALDLVPDHFAARLLRAEVNERQGRSSAALDDLEILLRARPEHPELHLRAGTLRWLLGEPESAVTSLRRALELGSASAPAPGLEWVPVVARQELARLEAALGRGEAAAELLREGLEIHPANRRLAIQLAELERLATGRPNARSREILDRWRRDEGPSPRASYTNLAMPELQANSRRIDRAARATAPDLARVAERLLGPELDVSRRCAGLRHSLEPSKRELRAAQRERERRRENASSVADSSPSRRAASSPRPPSTRGPAAGGHAVSADLASPALGAAPIGPGGFDTGVGSGSSLDLEIRSGSVYRDPETGEEFRVDEVVELDLRQVYVTASGFGDRESRLEKHELTLLDDGREQTIVTLEQGDIPFTASLLVDASESMEGERLGRALAGVRAFVDGMGPFDRARLLVAADRIRELSPFVAAGDEAAHSLGQRLAGTTAAGGTALYDHLFLALDALEAEQGRKVVIVLSDGYDLMSVVSAETIRGVVQRGQIQLYWIRLVKRIDPRVEQVERIPPSPWRTERRNKAQLRLFEETVKQSGGRIVAIDRDGEVSVALAEILAELRAQIAIGYYAEPRYGDGRWRELEIDTRRRGVKLRYVNGYIDD